MEYKTKTKPVFKNLGELKKYRIESLHKFINDIAFIARVRIYEGKDVPEWVHESIELVLGFLAINQERNKSHILMPKQIMEAYYDGLDDLYDETCAYHENYNYIQ